MHKVVIKRAGAGVAGGLSGEVEVLMGELAALASRARRLGLNEVAHFAAVAAAAANDACRARRAPVARRGASRRIAVLHGAHRPGRHRLN